MRRCYASGSLSSLTAGPVTVVAACEAAQPRSPPKPVHTRQLLAGAVPPPVPRRAQPRRFAGPSSPTDARRTFEELPGACRERARRVSQCSPANRLPECALAPPCAVRRRAELERAAPSRSYTPTRAAPFTSRAEHQRPTAERARGVLRLGPGNNCPSSPPKMLGWQIRQVPYNSRS